MTTYTYATLDPRPTTAAQQANDAVFAAGPVYGLEVTIQTLADRCVANLDPQHLGGDASTAAIEAAVDWPLPPAGATLATVRADADSVGAMAVLLLRSAGYLLWQGALDRIRVIADADKEASGSWPGVRPVPAAEALVTPATPVMSLAADHRKPLAQRVALVADWLRGDNEVEALLAEYRERALMEAQEALDTLAAQVVDGVAVISGSHRLAMSIGYRMAPVVVATNPEFRFAGGEPHVKHTVARWASGLPMDWDGMLAQLRGLEDGWGGSSSICGSPQGAGSKLTTDQVVTIVTRSFKGDARMNSSYPETAVCPECAVYNGEDEGGLIDPRLGTYRCIRGHIFTADTDR